MPTLPDLVIYAFCILVIGAGLYILLTKNLLYAAFILLFLFLAIAALYVLAGADFVAATQIIVYVGGVLILLLFGIMFTARHNSQLHIKNKNAWVGIFIGTGIFAVLGQIILKTPFNKPSYINETVVVTEKSVQRIGIELMTDFLVPFEIAAILLLITLIGAASIAGRKN